MIIRTAFIAAVWLGIWAGCSEEKLPSRDEIPILRERVYQLEQAVLRRSPAAIDSLASSEILEAGLSSDSLLNFVYGAGDDFKFAKFDKYSIFYDNKIAVVSCVIADSAGETVRPVKLVYRKYDKAWLLTSFQAVSDTASKQ